MLTLYLYPIALAVISIVVAGLEALFPKRREQEQLRERLWSDVVHLVFNGHFLGVIIYGLAVHYAMPVLDGWLTSMGWMDLVYRNAAAAWPVWAQIIVALVVVDFVQWSVHNLLHRVPFLWEFHKTHHSVVDGEMDWIVSFRFQWTEVMVYKAIQYLPLAFFGFGTEAVMFHAIFGTFIGHLNHANLDWDWGPLKYVLNSPNMHIWHHDYEGDTHTTVNFGIIFSCWDWIFGTAKMPDHEPKKIGFDGVEEFPNNFFSQAVWPLQQAIPALQSRQALASVMGLALVGTGWFVSQNPPQKNTAPPVTPMFGEELAASQPAAEVKADASAYGASEADRAAALERFGAEAKAEGYAHPEALVSVGELAAALGHPRLVLLDVRPMERFKEGHIPTARQLYRGDYSVSEPVPGVSRSPEELRALLSRVGAGEGAVVVAYTDGGPEAFRLWWTMREVLGFPIRVLNGGLQQWKARGHGLAMGEGLPVEPAAPLKVAAEAPHRGSWGDVAAFLKAHPNAVMLDTRSTEEYSGEEQHRKAKRAGHIPGARHIQWYAVGRGESDHRLLPPEELRQTLAAVGATDGAPVVTYCQSGTRSSGTLFALHQLGFADDQIMNYDGSWAEYSRGDEPVER